MHAIMVLNGKAGTALKADSMPSVAELGHAFAQLGAHLSIWETEGKRLDEVFREAVLRRPDAIFAAGGDGTISAAAGVLVGTGIPLAAFPFGTLNHFAHDLGVPGAWRDAARALVTAPTRTVDVGEVNGRVFINNCSLGSYGEAVRRREALRRERGHGKWRAMLIASWMVFRELRRLRFQIETPSGSVVLRSPFAVVANNRYSGHVFEASLRPRLDEGRLWIYAAPARTRWSLLRLLAQALTRRIDDAEGLVTHEATEATITVAKGPLHIACDGEVVDLAPPLRFRIRPRALTVLVPAVAPPP